MSQMILPNPDLQVLKPASKSATQPARAYRNLASTGDTEPQYEVGSDSPGHLADALLPTPPFSGQIDVASNCTLNS